jgi:chorismate mutase
MRPVVEVGPAVRFGGSGVPVVAAPRTGADVARVDLRRVPVRPGRGSGPDGRAETAGPVVAEVAPGDDLRRASSMADAVAVRVDITTEASDLAGSGDLDVPVMLHGELPAPAWAPLASALGADRAGGGSGVVVVLAGAGADLAGIGSVRRATGVPVVVDLGESTHLAGPAVAAGADGLWLAATATGAVVSAVRETAAVIAPLVRSGVPDTLPACREAIDGVDATLAVLLERRVELAAAVQRLKPLGGHAGRDHEREASIVRAMGRRAPSLSRPHLLRIMGEVIAAGLDVAEQRQPLDPPVWRM